VKKVPKLVETAAQQWETRICKPDPTHGGAGLQGSPEPATPSLQFLCLTSSADWVTRR
jgi:hypothetical protein